MTGATSTNLHALETMAASVRPAATRRLSSVRLSMLVRSHVSHVLLAVGLDELSFGVNVLILAILAVVFRYIAYFLLRRNGPVYDHAI